MKRMYHVLCPCSLTAALLCAPFPMKTCRMGFLFFITLFVCTGVMCLFYRWRDRSDARGKISHICITLGNIAFLLWLLSFAVIEGCILSAGFSSPADEDTSMIFILGGGIRGDQPSQNLRNRLEVGLDAMAAYPDARVIVCGGKGTNETIAEAEVMYRWLCAHGGDETRITREAASSDTVQNIQNAIAICEENNWSTEHVTIISSRFHLFRIRHIMKALGLQPSTRGAASGNPAISSLMYLREYFSVIKMIITGYY